MKAKAPQYWRVVVGFLVSKIKKGEKNDRKRLLLFKIKRKFL